jgi:hypothetical protein
MSFTVDWKVTQSNTDRINRDGARAWSRGMNISGRVRNWNNCIINDGKIVVLCRASGAAVKIQSERRLLWWNIWRRSLSGSLTPWGENNWLKMRREFSVSSKMRQGCMHRPRRRLQRVRRQDFRTLGNCSAACRK